MPHHEEKRLLPFSASRMFDLVADVGRYPEFLPWCKGALIRSCTSKAMLADLVVGAGLFREKFTSEVILDRPRKITVRYCSGPLSRLTTVWSFAPKGRNACEVYFLVDFDFRSPLLKAVMDLFFDKALAKMVGAFEERAKAIYQTKSTP